MLTKRFKDALDSYWAKQNAFRLVIIVTFLVLITGKAFLTWYIFREYAFVTFILSLILLGIAYKKGYGKQRPKRAAK